MRQARLWLAGAALLGLGWVIIQTNSSRAGEDKAAKDGILKIAKALQKGDSAEATKLAAALAKKLDPDEGLHDVMHLFKPRSKKGLGVGAKPGEILPDGIELKLLKLADPKQGISAAAVKKEGPALEEMGFVMAAIAEVAMQKPPSKDSGKKTKRDWMTWSKEMRDGAIKLGEAARAQSAPEVKSAAAKLNDSCANCHAVFKPGT